jgi:hypothetical protein
MRYLVQPKIVGKDHPYFGFGTKIYYLFDIFKNQLSAAYYTSEEKAKYWCNKKNGINNDEKTANSK